MDIVSPSDVNIHDRIEHAFDLNALNGDLYARSQRHCH